MTTSVQPVLPVCASAPVAWSHLSKWQVTASGAGWGDCDRLPVTALTESVLLQQLRGLSPSERNARVSSLSEGQLCALGSPDSAGLTFGEQCELFDLLASSLDGHHLARVSAAYLPSLGAKRWADSLCQRASVDAKQAFLRAWVVRLEAAPSNSGVAAMGVDATASTASLFAASALAGLASHTRQVDEALQLLASHPCNVGRLQSVIAAAGQMHLSRSACLLVGAATATCDPELLCRLIDASACGTSHHAKASVFQLSAQMLGKMAVGDPFGHGPMIFRNDFNAAVVQSLTRLVCSGTTGVLGSLETHHSGGEGLVVFVSEMLRQRRTNELRVMTEQLRRGHDASEDPVSYLAQHDAWGRYRRAATLGYYVGAVQIACQGVCLDRKLCATTLVATLVGGLAGDPQDQSNLWLSGGAACALQSLSAPSLPLEAASIAERLVHNLNAGSASDAVAALVWPGPLACTPFANTGGEIAFFAAMRRVFDVHRVVSAISQNPSAMAPT